MKKFFKILLWMLLVAVLIPFVLLIVLYNSADMGEPKLSITPSEYIVLQRGDSLFCKGSYLRLDSCGLWELYVNGSGQRRGALQGALTADLMKHQEDVFVDQIKLLVPSDRYLGFLRTFIIIFNRNLGEHIPLEYREEIVSMSEFCTHDYDAIGSPYERQLNYHAAHDIGHTMQQYMLVGCSSFGVWGDKSENNSLLVGRNFDFYVGDEFARNKLITFAAPDSGYRYASIGWAGMIGVLSGMNEQGLTVTINAAKGAIPTSASTPISLLTREILQYASNINEAYTIAKSRQTFVSESILIGSINDNKCAIIEKTPKQTVLYFSKDNSIICTNHFQSTDFANDSYNIDNILNSDSKYRYDRLNELLIRNRPINYKNASTILRDRYGAGGEDIGIANEMTINQSIAHHSVIFAPNNGLMWLSTSPWQSGKMVCYNLNDFFAGISYPARESKLDINADADFMINDYSKVINYRKGISEIKYNIKEGYDLSNKFIESFKQINPNHYYTYRILGDYYLSKGAISSACNMYKRSLDCSIPYKTERQEIEKTIKELEK